MLASNSSNYLFVFCPNSTCGAVNVTSLVESGRLWGVLDVHVSVGCVRFVDFLSVIPNLRVIMYGYELDVRIVFVPFVSCGFMLMIIVRRGARVF